MEQLIYRYVPQDNQQEMIELLPKGKVTGVTGVTLDTVRDGEDGNENNPLHVTHVTRVTSVTSKEIQQDNGEVNFEC
jgi:hypothetical protein